MIIDRFELNGLQTLPSVTGVAFDGVSVTVEGTFDNMHSYAYEVIESRHRGELTGYCVTSFRVFSTLHGRWFWFDGDPNEETLVNCVRMNNEMIADFVRNGAFSTFEQQAGAAV